MHILPTRGRPLLLQRYFDQGEPHECGVVVIDSDQEDLYRVVKIPPHWEKMIVPRMLGFVRKCNLAFERYRAEPWYGFGGDDVVGRTPFWDSELAHEARQGYIVWGDDLFNHQCSHPFIYGDFCRDVGWVAHPAFKHLYVDAIWQRIGETLGIARYRSDVVMEAHHWANGKMKFDKTASERMEHMDADTYRKLDMAPIIQTIKLRCESLSR